MKPILVARGPQHLRDQTIAAMGKVEGVQTLYVPAEVDCFLLAAPETTPAGVAPPDKPLEIADNLNELGYEAKEIVAVRGLKVPGVGELLK